MGAQTDITHQPMPALMVVVSREHILVDYIQPNTMFLVGRERAVRLNTRQEEVAKKTILSILQMKQAFQSLFIPILVLSVPTPAARTNRPVQTVKFARKSALRMAQYASKIRSVRQTTAIPLNQRAKQPTPATPAQKAPLAQTVGAKVLKKAAQHHPSQRALVQLPASALS